MNLHLALRWKVILVTLAVAPRWAIAEDPLPLLAGFERWRPEEFEWGWAIAAGLSASHTRITTDNFHTGQGCDIPRAGFSRPSPRRGNPGSQVRCSGSSGAGNLGEGSSGRNGRIGLGHDFRKSRHTMRVRSLTRSRPPASAIGPQESCPSKTLARASRRKPCGLASAIVNSP